MVPRVSPHVAPCEGLQEIQRMHAALAAEVSSVRDRQRGVEIGIATLGDKVDRLDVKMAEKIGELASKVATIEPLIAAAVASVENRTTQTITVRQDVLTTRALAAAGLIVAVVGLARSLLGG